jgi:hypothetical protein
MGTYVTLVGTCQRGTVYEPSLVVEPTAGATDELRVYGRWTDRRPGRPGGVRTFLQIRSGFVDAGRAGM